MQIKEWIATNEKGRAIFYVYIHDFMGIRAYDTNLPDLDRYRNLKSLLGILLNTESSDEQIESAAKELIENVKKVDDFRPFYLPGYALDNEGKFVQETYDAINEKGFEKENVQLKSWCPYSPTINADLFSKVVRLHIISTLRLRIHSPVLTKISKAAFERRLKYSELMDCYLDHYRSDLTYYHFTSDEGGGLLMQHKGEIKMVFFTWLAIEVSNQLFR